MIVALHGNEIMKKKYSIAHFDSIRILAIALCTFAAFVFFREVGIFIAVFAAVLWDYIDPGKNEIEWKTGQFLFLLNILVPTGVLFGSLPIAKSGFVLRFIDWVISLTYVRAAFDRVFLFNEGARGAEFTRLSRNLADSDLTWMPYYSSVFLAVTAGAILFSIFLPIFVGLPSLKPRSQILQNNWALLLWFAGSIAVFPGLLALGWYLDIVFIPPRQTKQAILFPFFIGGIWSFTLFGALWLKAVPKIFNDIWGA